MTTIAVMIDGGFVRVLERRAGKTYNPTLIEQVGVSCRQATEQIQRILYCDCF